MGCIRGSPPRAFRALETTLSLEPSIAQGRAGLSWGNRSLQRIETSSRRAHNHPRRAVPAR